MGDAAPPSPPALVAPAPPPPPAAQFAAATDIRPRDAEEKALCARASHADWFYLGGLVALDVVSIVAHATLKQDESSTVRTLGAGFIGLTWGATIGGAVLALPACEPHYVPSPPPEGIVRSRWPLAIAVSMIATTTAPFVVGIVTGPLPSTWTYTERSSRLYVAAGAGLVGSILPYIPIPILSPVPYRAARELERLRFAPLEGGGMGVYTTRF